MDETLGASVGLTMKHDRSSDPRCFPKPPKDYDPQKRALCRIYGRTALFLAISSYIGGCAAYIPLSRLLHFEHSSAVFDTTIELAFVDLVLRPSILGIVFVGIFFLLITAIHMIMVCFSPSYRKEETNIPRKIFRSFPTKLLFLAFGAMVVSLWGQHKVREKAAALYHAYDRPLIEGPALNEAYKEILTGLRLSGKQDRIGYEQTETVEQALKDADNQIISIQRREVRQGIDADILFLKNVKTGHTNAYMRIFEDKQGGKVMEDRRVITIQ